MLAQARSRFFGALALASVAGNVHGEAPVQIQVYGEHAGENLTFHYILKNNSTKSFRVFNIGATYDKDTGDWTEQLGSLPVGWRFGAEGEVGTEILLDPSSMTQPAGWNPSVYGGGFYTLEWSLAFGDVVTPPIEAGETREGFSVTVPDRAKHKIYPYAPKGTDEAYFKGGFVIGFPHEYQNGNLEVIDKAPPSLSISATPSVLWPPNGQLVSVEVSVAVHDDYDKQPAVRLESITANEPLDQDSVVGAEVGTDDRAFQLKAVRSGSGSGRTYKITYSATDAVGNTMSATTSVEVPHDQRAAK